ncbi:hypothetical protein U9M48_022915 [Paspalum notatum var. saurae]|uniref:Uncharacterized protein n=1 Tax=Paspalum notatum var. saurae TaxID=547442 RepID=A0AAQ3TKR2_PASNO
MRFPLPFFTVSLSPRGLSAALLPTSGPLLVLAPPACLLRRRGIRRRLLLLQTPPPAPPPRSAAAAASSKLRRGAPPLRRRSCHLFVLRRAPLCPASSPLSAPWCEEDGHCYRGRQRGRWRRAAHLLQIWRRRRRTGRRSRAPPSTPPQQIGTLWRTAGPRSVPHCGQPQLSRSLSLSLSATTRRPPPPPFARCPGLGGPPREVFVGSFAGDEHPPGLVRSCDPNPKGPETGTRCQGWNLGVRSTQVKGSLSILNGSSIRSFSLLAHASARAHMQRSMRGSTGTKMLLSRLCTKGTALRRLTRGRGGS